MKRVIIVRHAKSVPYGYEHDFTRDLTERGMGDADKISRHLREHGIIPDLVISSPATRALKTAGIFCSNLNYSIDSIKELSEFYEGMTTHQFIELLQQLQEEVNTVMFFGHNPTVYYLISNLASRFNADVPTCSTIALDFDIGNWKKLEARSARIGFQLTPKSI